MSNKYTGVVSADFPEQSAALLPCLIADNVAGDYADTNLQSEELAKHLEAKFASVYRANPSWGKKFIKQNEKSRDLMTAFFRHWSEAFCKKNWLTQYKQRVKTYESKCFEFTKRHE